MTQRRLLIALAWVVVFLIALPLDRPISTWTHQSGFWEIVKHSPVSWCIKAPGTFYFTIALAVLVLIQKPWHWRGAAELWISNLLAGLCYSIGKWAVGRTRPFKEVDPFFLSPFKNGLKGLFWGEKNQAFPSGHTSLAFATALTMTFLFPKYWWIFFSIAVLVGLERIAENAHYPSDVIAGAAFGVLSAMVARVLVDRTSAQKM